MSPSTLERRNEAWVEHHAHEWVDAGLISESQATAIGEYEHRAPPPTPQRLPIGAEIASYLGSVLAIMGGAVAVGERWSDITMLGRLGIGIAIAVVGFVAGTWLMRIGETGTARLGSYLWVLGTGGVGMAVGVVVHEIDSEAGGWLAVLIGLPVLTIGLTLWRNLDRALQFLTGAAGYAIVLGGLADLLDLRTWHAGLVLIATGVLFAFGAAVRRLEPRLIVLATGVLGAYAGAVMLGDYNEHLGPAMALVTAASLIAFSLRERIVPLLALGVVASLIATQALLATTFTGALASTIVALLGLLVVVAAVMQTRRNV